MILLHFDDTGNLASVEQVEDLPSNYDCSEWKAYNAACDRAQPGEWTQEQADTYAAYDAARKRGFK